MDPVDFSDRTLVGCNGQLSAAAKLIHVTTIRGYRDLCRGGDGVITQEILAKAVDDHMGSTDTGGNMFMLTRSVIQSRLLEGEPDNAPVARAPTTRSIVSKKS